MKVIFDIFGRPVRLTENRLGHIVETHPEMVDQLLNLEETLVNPYAVIESINGNAVQLFYRKFRHISFGDKYLCVVVKIQSTDNFIITAYITDAIKKGRHMEKNIKVWFDKESDFLEVLFDVKAGYFKETENEDVMEKVDADGNVIGFSILHVSQHEKSPITFGIKSSVA